MGMVKRIQAGVISWVVFISFLVLVLFPALGDTAYSKNYTVTTVLDTDCSDNECDFQSALTEANNNSQGDTINVSAGTYPITSTLAYNFVTAETHPITILGDGPVSTILDGDNSVQVLSIFSPVNVVVRGLKIQKGDSSVAGDGGGLFISSNGSVTVENCIFEGNTAGSFDGGGAKISAGTGGAVIGSIEFRSNSASTGGGLQVVNANDGVILENSLFDQNQSVLEGGGADLATILSGEVTVRNNLFTENSAGDQGRGGGLHLQFVEGANVQGNDFTGNSVGINCYGDPGCGGGGAHLEPGGGTVRIISNTFSGNISPPLATGGGLKVFDIFATTSLTAVNNVFLNNFGGAVDYETGQVGYALNGTLNFTNNTAVLNSGVGVNIDINENSQTVNVYNNIIHSNDNSDLVVFDRPTAGTATVNVFNNDMAVFSVVSAIGNTVNQSLGGNITDDPVLVNPAGGDVHLDTGSPAIDAGLDGAPGLTATAFDFEGHFRIQGPAVDMGADETNLAGSPNIVVTDSVEPSDDLSLSFSETCTGSSDVETVTITNVGVAELNVQQITGNSNFSVVSTTDNCSNQSVPAGGGTCTLEVQFTPSSDGNITGSLTIPSDDPLDATVTLSLEGKGTSTLTAPVLLYPSEGANREDTDEVNVSFGWEQSQSCIGGTVTYDFFLKDEYGGFELMNSSPLSSSNNTVNIIIRFEENEAPLITSGITISKELPLTGNELGALLMGLILITFLAGQRNRRFIPIIILLIMLASAALHMACTSTGSGFGGDLYAWQVIATDGSESRESEVRSLTVRYLFR